MNEKQRFVTFMVAVWTLLVLHSKLVMDDEEKKIHKSFIGKPKLTIVKPQRSSLICVPSCIGHDLKIFLGDLVDIRASIFLIEPWLLLKLTEHEEEKILKVGEVMSFGILGDNVLSLPSSLLHDQESHVGRGHIFHRVAETLVHFVIFERVDEYFQVNQLPDVIRWNITEDEFELMAFGKYDAIFDLNQFEKVVIDGTQVLIPEDVKEFLNQILSSQLVECGNDSRKYFRKTVLGLTRSEVMLKYALHHIKSILREIHVPVILFGDKLLEWSKTCRVNSTSTRVEVDLATYSEFASYDLITYLHSGPSVMRVESVSGFPHNGFHVRMTFLRNGVKMNLYFLYEEGESYVITKHIPHHLTYPKFDLCSSSFVGEKVLVPCQSVLNFDSAEMDSNYYSYVSRLLQNARKPSWPKSWHSHGKNFHVQNPLLNDSTKPF